VEISSYTAEQVDCHSAFQERPVNTDSHTLDIEWSVKDSQQKATVIMFMLDL